MRITCVLLAAIFVIFAVSALGEIVPTTLDDFFLPGSQPGQSGNLEHPSKCDNCHGGYDQAVEPAFNWRGSMMAQAARDPFFYACLAIANQDAPQSGDLCIRCHSPSGWLEGRSVPTDGSALNSNDREGVQCDFCHKLVAPSLVGGNPYPDDPDYTAGTYPWDQGYLQTLSDIPPTSANGMYIADSDNAKRGPFVDAAARHQMFYSPFHRDAALCGTCHDVSNPAFTKDANGRYVPNSFGQPAPDFEPYSMFPIERTYSEWVYSSFNGPGGASCQDCHMRDVTGYGCNKRGAPLRTELPQHDLTGGNTFVPPMIAALFPGEVDPAALNAGLLRATQTLQSAATMTVSLDSTAGFTLNVRVENETGHKLPSGYPEGRRIWVNVQAVDTNGTVVYESGAYNTTTGELNHDADLKMYHIEPGISNFLSGITGLPAGPSFHFVINDTVYLDNRIPPAGFTNENFEMIGSAPVGYSYSNGQNFDDTQYQLPGGLAHITVNLFYQTTSKEYVEFLRDENITNNWGQILYDQWVANGRNAPVAMATETITLVQIADNEPPTAPTNLNARAISGSQIDLSWTESIDNIGVAGYYIHRDNALVDSTVDAVYSDTGLQQRTTYSYYVTAYDAAGNVSEPSNTASARTRKTSGNRKMDGAECPMDLSISASPNPFNATTRISYSLAEASEVTLEIYNIGGQKITTLENGWKAPGVHTVNWAANDYATGMYFVRLNTGLENRVQKIVLLK